MTSTKPTNSAQSISAKHFPSCYKSYTWPSRTFSMCTPRTHESQCSTLGQSPQTGTTKTHPYWSGGTLSVPIMVLIGAGIAPLGFHRPPKGVKIKGTFSLDAKLVPFFQVASASCTRCMGWGFGIGTTRRHTTYVFFLQQHAATGIMRKVHLQRQTHGGRSIPQSPISTTNIEQVSVTDMRHTTHQQHRSGWMDGSQLGHTLVYRPKVSQSKLDTLFLRMSNTFLPNFRHH